MASTTRRDPPLPETRVRLPRTVRRFLDTEASGGVVLLVSAAVAVIWANSPWRGGYEALWHTRVTLEAGSFRIEEDLVHWVNDGLMALFFFVVGLEIKRELVVGDLRNWRRASLPAIAALGGMIGPALVFFAINVGQPGARGWGVPMATDIAFAVGALVLLGDRVPQSLKLFLLTLAIVDDVGAIVVIAVFYNADLDWRALGLAAALVGVVVMMRRLHVRSVAPYAVVGALVWLAVFESGVHATIAGVVLGLLAPARPLAAADVVRDWASDLQDEPGPRETRALTNLASHSVSVAERLEDLLHPYTSYVIIPLFALANAGVALDLGAFSDAAAARVGLGVAAGLVVGKTVGVTAFAWGADRLGIGELPSGVNLGQLIGVAAVAGIGFTVSLFIADLAFTRDDLEAAAKLGIFAASILATVVGGVVLSIARPASVSEN